MKTKIILQEILVAILVILFVYTPASKLMKFHEYQLAMDAQPITAALRTFVLYAVPISEILAVILMAIPKFRKVGLYVTLGLLLTFTGYITLIQMNYYGRIPCSCGGVIKSLSWTQHLYFNLTFITINIIAIWLHSNIAKNERKTHITDLSAV